MSKTIGEKILISLVIYYLLLWFSKQPLPFLDFFPDLDGFKTIAIAALVILGGLTIIKLPKTD